MKKFAFVAVCLLLTVSAVRPARGVVVTGTVGDPIPAPEPRRLTCDELAAKYDWGIIEYLFCLIGN